MPPEFPHFKSIQLEDREFIRPRLWEYQPETSELTFTNLFIWRSHYGCTWSVYKHWLICLFNNGDTPCILQPIGPAPRQEITRVLLEWLAKEKAAPPRIERADRRFVAEVQQIDNVRIEPTREHFDYVYRSTDLKTLAGAKYHRKKNHINTFHRTHSFTYSKLTEKHMKACMELIEVWCGMRRCEEDMNLLGEWEAIGEILAHYQELNVHGGVILLDNKVEAFTIGELLNNKTAVIHIEKANPEFNGLYAVMNQQFVENTWNSVPFINREQDLGVEGLRKAKLSYHPERLVEKFRITLSQSGR
ncbi:MAG: DUF2156 domain-containing protein [candidate division WOR-3 bacterium]|nr:MAG: DUF2156 domain-containing protein [candidate division WOR-3 bacterium]